MGFPFGLDFDTLTEVAPQGLSIWTIMVFPAMFTVGMTLVDTTDGVLVQGAYEWAFVTPMRKLYYNVPLQPSLGTLKTGVPINQRHSPQYSVLITCPPRQVWCQRVPNDFQHAQRG